MEIISNFINKMIINMKNRMKLGVGVLILMALFVAAACAPQYDDGGHELGIPGTVTADQISLPIRHPAQAVMSLLLPVPLI